MIKKARASSAKESQSRLDYVEVECTASSTDANHQFFFLVFLIFFFLGTLHEIETKSMLVALDPARLAPM